MYTKKYCQSTIRYIAALDALQSSRDHKRVALYSFCSLCKKAYINLQMSSVRSRSRRLSTLRVAWVLTNSQHSGHWHERVSEPQPPVSLRAGRRATETERARDRYAMARKYAGINVKTQEAAIAHRLAFRAGKLPAVLCFFRSVLSTWSL